MEPEAGKLPDGNKLLMALGSKDMDVSMFVKPNSFGSEALGFCGDLIILYSPGIVIGDVACSGDPICL